MLQIVFRNGDKVTAPMSRAQVDQGLAKARQAAQRGSLTDDYIFDNDTGHVLVAPRDNVLYVEWTSE